MRRSSGTMRKRDELLRNMDAVADDLLHKVIVDENRIRQAGLGDAMLHMTPIKRIEQMTDLRGSGSYGHVLLFI